jgi:hypothetical protein
MCPFLCQRDRLVTPGACLVWVALHPEEPGYPAPGSDTWVTYHVEQRLDTRRLGIVERDALFDMGTGGDKLAKEAQRRPQRPMCLDKERGVLQLLSQTQELFIQFPTRLQIAPHDIKRPQPQQRGGELWCLPDLLAEVPRLGEDLLDLRICHPPGGGQRDPEGNVQGECLLQTLRRLWKPLESCQPLLQMVYRFHIR